MDGTRLLRILIEATGLPPESLELELTEILSARGVSLEQLTLDDVREVLASYLQDTLVEAKEASRL
jgi:hypothetical protein